MIYSVSTDPCLDIRLVREPEVYKRRDQSVLATDRLGCSGDKRNGFVLVSGNREEPVIYMM